MMNSRRFMLDLCSGLGGTSAAMRKRGWKVITIDNENRFNPDICVDVREWHYPHDWPEPDLVWASPPCTEFAKEFMPWSRTGNEPDMSIVLACKRIIEESKPRYWIIENVIGAVQHFRPIFGNYRFHIGPYYLWGYFPPIGNVNKSRWRKKESLPSVRDDLRSLIPIELSEAVAVACEAYDPIVEGV